LSMELLAPAGNFEKLRYALAYGADAVYGAYRSFGLRSAGDNFDGPGLKEAIDYCHGLDKKMYITVNIYPTSRDLEQLPAFFEMLEELRPDGMIIADLGVMALAKRHAPHIPIHVSTQANVTNFETAMVLAELGAKRLVLAREMPVDEILHLRQHLPQEIELECFVHGAMCISYSGRCLLSAAMVNRSANQGACAHPCRWNYALMEEKRPGEYFPIEEDGRGTYIMNSKDLCLIQHLQQLQECGVASLKIEGRMKSFYYAACVTRAYRRALDDLKEGKPFDPTLLEELRAVSHRDYTTGFFNGVPGAEAQEPQNGGYIRLTDVVAVATDQPGIFIQKNKFSLGEELEVLTPQAQPYGVTVEQMADEKGIPIESAPHAQMTVQLPLHLPPYSILRRNRKAEL